MIERFEVGKTYRYIGKELSYGASEEMKQVLDGKPRKCIRVRASTVDGAVDQCCFEGMGGNARRGIWSWYGDLENFEEIDMS